MSLILSSIQFPNGPGRVFATEPTLWTTLLTWAIPAHTVWAKAFVASSPQTYGLKVPISSISLDPFIKWMGAYVNSEEKVGDILAFL